MRPWADQIGKWVRQKRKPEKAGEECGFGGGGWDPDFHKLGRRKRAAEPDWGPWGRVALTGRHHPLRSER